MRRVLGVAPALAAAAEMARFTPLSQLAAPKILAAAQAFNDQYSAENILKPPTPAGHRSDYASRGLGEGTYIDFDFGQPVRLAAFWHLQRRTPDTIAEANLIFSETPDFKQSVATVKVRHVDEPGATTFAAFTPVNARYVRWQVTSVLPGRSRNVGGQGIEFFTAGPAEASPHGLEIDARTVQVVERQGNGLLQPLKITLNWPYAETTKALVRAPGLESRTTELRFGRQNARLHGRGI